MLLIKDFEQRKELKKLINILEKEPTKKGIKDALIEFQQFGKPIVKDNILFINIFSISFLILLIFNNFLSNTSIIIIAIFGTFLPIIFMLITKDNVDVFIEKIQTILLENDKIKYSNKNLSYFQKNFILFCTHKKNRRYKYFDCKIKLSLILENFQAKEYKFDALIFHYYFEYKRGDKLHKENRFGIVTPFDTITDAFILDHIEKQHSFIKDQNQIKPVSVKFNDKFVIYAKDDIIATKLLKPTVVLELEKLSNELKNLSLQFSNNKLCIMFSNDYGMPNSIDTKNSLNKPAEFIKEITRHLNGKYELLDKVLYFVDFLKTQTDNNFENHTNQKLNPSTKKLTT